MKGSSQSKMKEANGVLNDEGEERRGYVVMSCIRMGGLKGRKGLTISILVQD